MSPIKINENSDCSANIIVLTYGFLISLIYKNNKNDTDILEIDRSITCVMILVISL